MMTAICPVLRTEVNASTWSGTPRNQHKSSTKESSCSRTQVGHSSLKHHQGVLSLFTTVPLIRYVLIPISRAERVS